MWKRNIFAGFLGGIAMFMWSSVAYVATPLASAGIKELPNEPAVLTVLQQQIGNAWGLYKFPGVGPGPDAPRSQTIEVVPSMIERMKTGPSGLLLYHNAGHGVSVTPDRLFLEFLTVLSEALIAAWLLAQTRLVSYASKVWFIVVLGLAAAITTNLPHYTWYGFPRRFTAAHMFVEIVGYLCAALVIAWLIKPGPAGDAKTVIVRA
jgi:hypothetical protein